MAGVHAESDLGLATITTEVAFAHQEPYEEAGITVREFDHAAIVA